MHNKLLHADTDYYARFVAVAMLHSTQKRSPQYVQVSEALSTSTDIFLNTEKMLFIFGGVPETGKTELSIHLSQKVGPPHLRIDTIKQAIRDGGITTRVPKGYIFAYKIAGDDLMDKSL